MSAVILEGCAGAVRILKCGCDHCSTTNVNDVWIAGIICGAIVLVAAIALLVFNGWNEKEKKPANTGDGTNNNYDPKIKQKAELQSRLLNFLEKNTITVEYVVKDGKNVKEEKQKSFDSKESQYYIDVLTALIKGDDVSAYLKEIKTDENKES